MKIFKTFFMVCGLLVASGCAKYEKVYVPTSPDLPASPKLVDNSAKLVDETDLNLNGCRFTSTTELSCENPDSVRSLYYQISAILKYEDQASQYVIANLGSHDSLYQINQKSAAAKAVAKKAIAETQVLLESQSSEERFYSRLISIADKFGVWLKENSDAHQVETTLMNSEILMGDAITALRAEFNALSASAHNLKGQEIQSATSEFNAIVEHYEKAVAPAREKARKAMQEIQRKAEVASQVQRDYVNCVDLYNKNDVAGILRKQPITQDVQQAIDVCYEKFPTLKTITKVEENK